MYYKIGYNRTITQTNHEISGNGSEEGSSHLEVNTEVPAHGLGGCNASQRNTMESEYQMKPQMYETRRKPSAAELTLGGVGRLPRVLHLEPKASKRRRKAGVSKGEAKSMAATRMQHARGRRWGEGDLTMAATGVGMRLLLRRRQERERLCRCDTGTKWGNPNGPVSGRAGRAPISWIFLFLPM